MAKYKEGRTGIRGHENQTIWNTKSDSTVSLDQISTSTARSSSDKRSRTPPHRISEDRDHHQQGSHSAGYGPWTPLSMHFHPGWSGPTEGFGRIGYYTGDGHYRYVGH
jgi:hypothetical protein